MKFFTRREFCKMSGATLFGLTVPNGLFEKNSKRIKIGQIGTEHAHAAGKMQTLRKLDGIYEVVGIVENDQALMKTAINESAYKGLKWMTEEELFNTKGIEAVAIEAEINDLVPTAKRCIDAGLHIHVDKPPGKSLSDFKELLEAAVRKNLLVQMGYMFRYNPAFQFLLQTVKKGWLGEIFEVDGVISKTINTRRRSKLAQTYGGSMMLLGCHLIDMLIAVAGKPNRVTSYPRQTFPDIDSLYDNDLAVFEYPKTTATIRSALVEVDGMKRRHFVVCGTNGTIEIKPLEPPVLRMALDKPAGNFKEDYQTIELPKMPGRYGEQLVDFARAIRKEKEADFSIEHDLAVHDVLLKTCCML